MNMCFSTKRKRQVKPKKTPNYNLNNKGTTRGVKMDVMALNKANVSCGSCGR